MDGMPTPNRQLGFDNYPDCQPFVAWTARKQENLTTKA
jgi:hypothetical protein